MAKMTASHAISPNDLVSDFKRKYLDVMQVD